MAYVVTQSCCSDASCVVACPVNCIHPAPGEPGFETAEMLYVDAASCVGCGACATACPVDAVLPAERLRPDQQPFIALNAEYYEVFPHAARRPLAGVDRQRRVTRPGPFRVAVVGAGPAGLYAADELLRHPEISVDVYDRLPTPYGLVRAGVAPDHQQTKQATRLFAQIESQPGFRYLLGVEVGRDLGFGDLAGAYHAVVHAGGAASDRPLGVPGEDLPGSLSATELVGWYNGHPDHQDLDVRLDGPAGRVVIVGNGNVALDVARILTAPAGALDATDVAGLPAAVLRRSTVREVVVLGRRGPVESAFTVPELVGLAGLADGAGVDVVVQGLDGVPADSARLRLLRQIAERTPTPGRRRIVLRFLTAPVRVLGDHTTGMTGLEVTRTRLVPDDNDDLRAVPTGETEIIPADLVLRSVGYRGAPVTGLPYEPVRGTVPSDRGRIRPGLYVVGWAKRGPTGFIGTNKSCAQETVARILDDIDAGALPDLDGTAAQLTARADALVAERCPEAIDLAGWRRIDAEERRRGVERGRPRTKIVEVAELVRVARGDPAPGVTGATGARWTRRVRRPVPPGTGSGDGYAASRAARRHRVVTRGAGKGR